MLFCQLSIAQNSQNINDLKDNLRSLQDDIQKFPKYEHPYTEGTKLETFSEYEEYWDKSKEAYRVAESKQKKFLREYKYQHSLALAKTLKEEIDKFKDNFSSTFGYPPENEDFKEHFEKSSHAPFEDIKSFLLTWRTVEDEVKKRKKIFRFNANRTWLNGEGENVPKAQLEKLLSKAFESSNCDVSDVEVLGSEEIKFRAGNKEITSRYQIARKGSEDIFLWGHEVSFPEALMWSTYYDPGKIESGGIEFNSDGSVKSIDIKRREPRPKSLLSSFLTYMESSGDEDDNSYKSIYHCENETKDSVVSEGKKVNSSRRSEDMTIDNESIIDNPEDWGKSSVGR